MVPVILFAYNRVRHLEQTIGSLRLNHGATDTPLLVFVDGPRCAADEPAVAQVIKVLRGVQGFQSVEIILRPHNLGLSRSIISGVTEALRRWGRVIVLEDDMATSPWFLDYMNQALDLYANDADVASIHGYCYPTHVLLPDTFFLRGADCWGWATWRRTWERLRLDGRGLLEELIQRRLIERFDLYGAFPYSRMLRDQIVGRNDSWAIRWYASMLLDGKFTLYPGRSLVHNIGNDGSGEHCVECRVFDVEVSSSPVAVKRIPVQEDRRCLESMIEFLRTTRRPLSLRILSYLGRRFLG